MRVAVDARHIYRRNRRGTGKNLIDLYRRIAAMQATWQFVLFHQLDGSDDPFCGLQRVANVQIDIRGDRLNLWEQVRLPLAAKAARADVLHCPANTSPRWPLVPTVVTIHDLIPLQLGLATSASRKWGRNVAAAARRACRVIAPSEYTKRQIVAAFGVQGDKITVNHWAADEACREVIDSAELNRVRAKYGLSRDRPYVLGFGSSDPRKNSERVVTAWAAIPRRLRRDYALLIVGVEGCTLGTLRARVNSLELAGTCHVCGFAPEEDLPALMSGATVLCYPSLSEGFGLPVLDAFACNTAVLTSNTTSLPEVAGDAAVLVDPEDCQSIAEALAELLRNERQRQELVARGRARLKKFTWQACAERTSRVFEEVVGKSS